MRAAQLRDGSQHVLTLVEDRGQIRVDDLRWPISGLPTRRTAATWFLFDHLGATAPVPNLPTQIDHIDLVFAHKSIPVLQLATRTGGLSYRLLDGTPLPSW